MKRIVKSQRYFNMIYLWIILALLGLLMIFSTIIYFSVERSVLRNNYDLNKQILSQVAYNVDSFDQTVENLCYSIFSNSDTKAILSLSNIGENFLSASSSLDNLRKTYMSNNAFIHSIYVYNGNSNGYLSTNKGIFTSDPQLEEAIRNYQTLPVLKPIYRKIESLYPAKADQTDDVFTYAMYDWLGKDGKPDGGIYVNIKADWMLENINRINTSDPKSKSNIYIVNDRKEIIGNRIQDGTRASLLTMYNNVIKNMNPESRTNFDFISMDINGQKSFVSYIYLSRIDWVLIKVQPYSEVYQYVDNIKFIIVLITAVFLIFALIAAYTISRRIYRPIDKLIKRINAFDIEKGTSNLVRDDIDFLNQTYNKYYESIQISNKENQFNDRLLKDYYLKNLLLDSCSMNPEDILHAIDKSKSLFEAAEEIIVCVIKIDNYKLFSMKSNKDQELIRFAVSNIMCELLSVKFKVEAVDMKKDQIALIINVAQGNQIQSRRDMLDLLTEAQSTIMNYFKVSVSISIGDIVDSISDLEKSYKIALNNANYRMILGKMSMITGEQVAENNENRKVDYSLHLDKKLVEEIKSGSIQNTETIIHAILEEIKEQNYNNMMLSIMHLVTYIFNTLYEVNKTKLKPAKIDYNVIDFILMELETLDEIFEEIMRTIADGLGEIKNTSVEKHIIIIETVKEFVDQNYWDNSLSLQLLSENLKMSSVYLGKIFRENMDVSLAEYINDVRLERARILLEQSQLTIIQIIEKIGMDNESYFYKLFKKKFGVTPKEYALKKAIGKR